MITPPGIRPFASVVLGATTREDFLKRYVALREDFVALDKILPPNAQLYVPNDRVPAVYAPRAVIFTLADWDRRTALYRMLVQPTGAPSDVSGLEPQTGLICGDVVYENRDAVVETYRTPSRKPERGAVLVQRCASEASGQEGLPPPQ